MEVILSTHGSAKPADRKNIFNFTIFNWLQFQADRKVVTTVYDQTPLMTRHLLTVFVLMYLFSCKSPETPQAKTVAGQDTINTDTSLQTSRTTPVKKLGFYTLEGDSVVVPPFEIEISLSPKAKEQIVNKETIIVAVFLEGEPKDISKVKLSEDGSFSVGSARREISFGEIARFDNLKFPKKIYDQLADKDADLTVNVYTGRNPHRTT